MAMKTIPNNMTIADFAEQIKNKQIVVNHTYQRTDKVWPTSAKSNLIDTILSGYPMPKLIFSQTTDLDTRKTKKEVVDGQQRTAAITEFLEGSYALTRGEHAGNKFEDLDDIKKREFFDYRISVDEFTSATDEEIREVFRRINSYQVPLNKQETRHATHQGEFKWFIRDMGVKYATVFVKIGIMSERYISRMVDLEFLTELVYALDSGIKTASPKALDKLYDVYDKSFPKEDSVAAQLNFGLGEIINLTEIHDTKLLSRANTYSLFAAIIAVKFKDSPLRHDLADEVAARRGFVPREQRVVNLTALADALEEEEGVATDFADFLLAARQGTNTERNRKTRFRWMHKALTTELV